MGEKWIVKVFHLKLCRDNSNMIGSTSNSYYSVFLKKLVTNTYAEALFRWWRWNHNTQKKTTDRNAGGGRINLRCEVHA